MQTQLAGARIKLQAAEGKAAQISIVAQEQGAAASVAQQTVTQLTGQVLTAQAVAEAATFQERLARGETERHRIATTAAQAQAEQKPNYDQPRHNKRARTEQE